MFEFLKAKSEWVESVYWCPQPIIVPRMPEEGDTQEIKEDKAEKPIAFCNLVKVFIKTNRRSCFELKIFPFNYDGATYPKILDIFIGVGLSPIFLRASAFHDYMCNFKHILLQEQLHNSITMDEYRRLSTLVFRQVLIEDGVSKLKANVMSFFVHLWQTTGNRGAWK